MNLLGEYKGTRKKPEQPEEVKRYEEFFEVLNQLPDELDEEVLKFRGIEADDLLAYLTQKVAPSYAHTWIVSSDKDLIQLLDTNISIFNIFSRKEVTVETLAEDTGLTASEFMLSRIIEGDKSDNIIGIEGIGPKRAQALAKEYKTIDKLLQALPIKGKSQYISNLNAGKDRLILNEKLINLKRYYMDAISAGKDGEDPLEVLNNL
jgi:DNA polymerase-1